VTGPLSGLLVADFSRVLAGPYLAMTLGDLGADVIKVERPGSGDDTRAWGPPWAPSGMASYYAGLNRNKRSVTLDLGDPGDRELAVRLATRADVMVENFRPGTLARFGLDYESVRERNPRSIYVSITAFGSAPQAAGLAGYDLLVQAMSGLMSITGPADGEPYKVGVALVDHIAALQGTVGVLAALRHRDRTGEGQHVEVSLMGAALAGLLNQASGFLATGEDPPRLGNRHPSIAPYQTFEAADGWFVVACGNDAQFRALAGACGLAGLADDERFATNTARVANVDALDGILTGAFRERPVAHWVETLNRAGVPAGPINTIRQAFELAADLGLEPVAETGPDRTVASPIRLSATPPGYRLPSPRLGEHDAEIRAWLADET
jgi:crotonobetainyl-CoA:carnitine CoA-transferase CaiB-like acyl-CoA transferase